MPKKKPIMRDIAVWWKIDNLLMSTDQMIKVGMIGIHDEARQLSLWLDGRIRTK